MTEQKKKAIRSFFAGLGGSDGASRFHAMGRNVWQGIEKDWLTGNAPGLSAGDYIDVALKEIIEGK